MRLAASPVQYAAMSSSRANARGRNPWRRGFCDRPRPPPDGQVGGAFVSGDSHVRTVRDANYGWRQGQRADASVPRGAPQQQFRPRPPPHFRQSSPGFRRPPPNFTPPPLVFGQPLPHFRPSPPSFQPPPPPRPADYRNWNYALSQPPPQCERFTVLSYNILADYLVGEHRPKLYFHIPHHILDWEWRKRKLLVEFRLWAADIMCLQEVDRFRDLEEELAIRGYSGVWKMRTGNAVDGCSIFWRTNKFLLRHEEHIEFSKLGLRDNVAQICVLESTIQRPVENMSASLPSSSSKGATNVIVCNIHVLYNPKRGEIKLGQVRVLLDRAYAISKLWDDAPVIVCGDFNCTPKSPLYDFVSQQKINLSGLARDQVSGQYSASIYQQRPFMGSGSYRPQPQVDDDSKVTTSVEQSSNHSEMQKHYEPQNNTGNISETEMHQPKVKINELDISAKQSIGNQCTKGNHTVSDILTKEMDNTDMVYDPSVDSSSTQCGISNPSKETIEGCDKLSRNPFSLGCDEKQTHTSTVLYKDDSISHGIQQICSEKDSITEITHSIHSVFRKDGSPSNPGLSNELIDALDLDSRSENEDNKLSQGLMDSSTCLKNTSNVSHNLSAISTTDQHFTCYKVHKEEVNVGRVSSSEGIMGSSHSGVAPQKALDAEIGLGNKLGDVVTEISSFEVVSDAFSANTEASSHESLTNASAGPATSAENTSESNLSDLSTKCVSSLGLNVSDVSLKEMDSIEIKEATVIGDDGIINSSGEILTCFEGNGSSDNIVYHHKSAQLETEETSPGAGISRSMGGVYGKELKNHSDDGQVDILTDDICTSEENSDPNFFKELLGTGDDCEFREEVTYMTSFGQTQRCTEAQEDSFIPIARPATDQEKCFHNPYVWTPMEIEVASGNAECTIAEHHLKLRSAYTDVEDYAGTKDSNREPQVTSYNRQFMGTVDYIWYSEGLQTVKVLDTIPKHVLQRTPGFPTQKWGSDHLALACQFAFTKAFQTK